MDKQRTGLPDEWTAGPKPSPNLLPPGYDPFALPGHYHRPNTFTLWERLSNSCLAAALIGYGAFGVVINDLFIPGKRSSGLHLKDAAAWLMYGALLCGAAVLLALVVDHYDTRNNEHHYATQAHGYTGGMVPLRRGAGLAHVDDVAADREGARSPAARLVARSNSWRVFGWRSP